MTVRGGVSWLSSSSAEIARARNVLKGSGLASDYAQRGMTSLRYRRAKFAQNRGNRSLWWRARNVRTAESPVGRQRWPPPFVRILITDLHAPSVTPLPTGNGRGEGPQVDLLVGDASALFDSYIRWAFVDATQPVGVDRYAFLTCSAALAAVMGVVARGTQNNFKLAALRPHFVGWQAFPTKNNS